MKKEYTRELQLLAIGLIKRGIQFEFREMFNGGQIIVYKKTNVPFGMTSKLEIKWDAICHDGSYGNNRGLLEIMGDLVDEDEVGDSVEGYLTAEEVLERIDKVAESEEE